MASYNQFFNFPCACKGSFNSSPAPPSPTIGFLISTDQHFEIYQKSTSVSFSDFLNYYFCSLTIS